MSILKQYATLQAWPNLETADIIYDDKGTSLTNVLTQQGYLQEKDWRDRKPKYFIEVKTTTADGDERFSLSGKQYDLVSINYYAISIP